MQQASETSEEGSRRAATMLRGLALAGGTVGMTAVGVAPASAMPLAVHRGNFVTPYQAHGKAKTWTGASGDTTTNSATAMVAVDGGKGAWQVTPEGGVAALGDAKFLGSLQSEGIHPSAPIVGIAATPNGKGYWLADANGAVFGFGNAAFKGTPGTNLPAPIVGIAATPNGKGYWLADANGAVFGFGNAAFFGTAGSSSANLIAGIVPAAKGSGYWLLESHSQGVTAAISNFHSAQVAAQQAAAARAAAARAAAAQAAAAQAAAAQAAAAQAAAAQAAAAQPAAPAVTAAAVSAPSGPGRYLGTFTVTCYDLSGTTASGAPVSTASVAVDPSVIPLGTTIDIGGVGTRIAQDTGGGIIGNRLDIWEPTLSQCTQFGVQQLPVWIAG